MRETKKFGINTSRRWHRTPLSGVRVVCSLFFLEEHVLQMNMTGNPNKYLWMVDSPRVMLSLMQKYQARCSSVKSNASYDMPTTRFLSNIIQTLSQKRRKSGDTLFSRAYNLQPQPMINPGHSQWSYHSHVAQLEQEGMPEWASSASAEFHLGSRG